MHRCVCLRHLLLIVFLALFFFLFCKTYAYLPNYKQCIFSEPSLNGLFFDVFSRRQLGMFVIRPVNFGDFCFYPLVFFSVCKQWHRQFVFQLLSSARRLILSLQVYGNYGMFCAIRLMLPPSFSCWKETACFFFFCFFHPTLAFLNWLIICFGFDQFHVHIFWLPSCLLPSVGKLKKKKWKKIKHLL